MSNSLEALFCHVDNFCKIFEPKWRQMLLGNGLQQRQRTRCLSMSEIMTILIGFHQNHYRNFKHFYEKTSVQILVEGVSQTTKLQQVYRVYGCSNDATVHI
ncbi:MAG: hypothetical protein ACK45T_20245 [Pseudanabaena sp.]